MYNVHIMDGIYLEQALTDLKELLLNIQTHSQTGESIVNNIKQIFQKHNFPLPLRIENHICRKMNDINELIAIIKKLIKMLEEQIMKNLEKVINSKKTTQTQDIIKPPGGRTR